MGRDHCGVANIEHCPRSGEACASAVTVGLRCHSLGGPYDGVGDR